MYYSVRFIDINLGIIYIIIIIVSDFYKRATDFRSAVSYDFFKLAYFNYIFIFIGYSRIEFGLTRAVCCIFKYNILCLTLGSIDIML